MTKLAVHTSTMAVAMGMTAAVAKVTMVAVDGLHRYPAYRARKTHLALLELLKQNLRTKYR